MIHLSTPTQPPGIPLASSHESADLQSGDIESSRDNLEDKTQKKNGLGIFAKLLDGLKAKGKIEQKGETDSNSESTEQAGESEKNRFLLSLSDSLKEADKIEVSGKENNSNTAFAFLRQNIDENSFQNTAEAFNPAYIEEEFALQSGEISFQELMPDEADLKDFALGSALPKEDGERNASTNLADGNAEIPVSDSFESQLELERNIERQLESNMKKADGREQSQQAAGRYSDERQTAAQQFTGRQASGETLVNAELKSAADSRLSDQRKPSDQVQDVRESRGRRSRNNIDFRDLRTGDIREAVYVDPAKASLKPPGMEIEIPVELKLSVERSEREAAGKAGNPPSLGKGFEDALARELRGNLSMDIVRNASIIARDGGEGTIRLSLRPASLGDVKVHLEMTENRIIGVIVVESSEALRAFERELPVLEKAFRDSGFSEASLEMSLAQDGGNFASGEEQQEDGFSSPSPVMAASRYEESERTEFSDSFMPVHDGMILSPDRTPVNLLV